MIEIVRHSLRLERSFNIGFRADSESQPVRAFFDEGNAITLQQLQRPFSAKRQQQSDYTTARVASDRARDINQLRIPARNNC
jgi:hypothetical protein